MYIYDTNHETEAIHIEGIDAHTCVSLFSLLCKVTVLNLLLLIRSVKDVFKGNGKITLIYNGGNVPKFEFGAIVQNVIEAEHTPARIRKPA